MHTHTHKFIVFETAQPPKCFGLLLLPS